jgi:hypothetical protein
MKERRDFFLILALIIGVAMFIGFMVSHLSSKDFPVHRNIALLFVGRDTSAPSMAIESELQKQIAAKRDGLKIFASDLPFYSYHFDKENEKKVCMGTFTIKEQDLPFLGVVEMDEKTLPVKVLFRMSCKKGGGDSLDAIIAAAARELKGEENPSPSGSTGRGRN